MNVAPDPAPELFVFMSVTPVPASSFSHINIFNCLGAPQVEWKINYTKYTKLKEYTKRL